MGINGRSKYFFLNKNVINLVGLSLAQVGYTILLGLRHASLFFQNILEMLWKQNTTKYLKVNLI
jgi:hypothetical protein